MKKEIRLQNRLSMGSLGIGIGAVDVQVGVVIAGGKGGVRNDVVTVVAVIVVIIVIIVIVVVIFVASISTIHMAAPTASFGI